MIVKLLLFGAGLLLLVMIRSAWRIRRWEGAILLVSYAGFMAYLLAARN